MDKREAAEIDLLQLIAAFFLQLKQNLLLTILLPVVGVGIALAISMRPRADIFESSLLVETSLLTDNECKFLFEQLDKVGIIPGLSEEEDQKVAGFSFKVTRNEGPVLTDQNPYQLDRSVYLEVTARVLDKDVLPALQKAVVNFINSSQSVVRHRNERSRFYSEMIARINMELSSMDEVKKQVTKTQATYLNPSELYASSVRLYEQKTEYEILAREIETIHLLKGFDSLTINAKTSLIQAILIGFGVGTGVLLLILFIRFFMSYFKQYEQKH